MAVRLQGKVLSLLSSSFIPRARCHVESLLVTEASASAFSSVPVADLRLSFLAMSQTTTVTIAAVVVVVVAVSNLLISRILSFLTDTFFPAPLPPLQTMTAATMAVTTTVTVVEDLQVATTTALLVLVTMSVARRLRLVVVVVVVGSMVVAAVAVVAAVIGTMTVRLGTKTPGRFTKRLSAAFRPRCGVLD